MMRKLVRSVLLLGGLVCVMGADSIDYNAGQPNPNPGGVANKIEANGTYALDPGHTLSSIVFICDDGIASNFTATATKATWSVPPVGINASTYKCTAQLYINDGQKIWMSANKSVNNVVVK